MYVDMGDHFGRDVFFDGEYESEEIRCIKRNIRKSGIFFDVGAHWGLFSIHLAKEGSYVHSFEPNPESFLILQKNISLNETSDRVTTHNIAVSDKSGTASFFCNKVSGLSSLKKSGRGKVNKVIEVQTTTLDTYSLSSGILPDFIKIDAENFEEAVIRGGQRTLSEHDIKILCELSSDGNSEDSGTKNTVVSYLQKMGYRLRRVFSNRNYFFEKTTDTRL